MIEDLETTLRITFDKDELRRSVEEAAREAGRAAGAAFTEAFRGGGSAGGPGAPRTGGGGGATPSGGGTRSSSDPAVLDEARGGSGDVGGGGGRRGGGGGRSRPSGGGTRSPADVDTGGGGGGGGGGGRRREPVDHSKPQPRDMYGHYLPRGSIDYQSYLSGQPLTRDTRMLLGAIGQGRQGAVAGSAIQMGAMHFGDHMMGLAKERIEFIDQQRRAGVAESALPTMGALRFAGPIGTAASVVAGAVANHIGKGLDIQDQYSTRYGQLAPMLASLKRQGPDRGGSQSAYFGFGVDNPESYLRRAARAEYGAQTPEEAFATLRAYESIGYRRSGGFDPKPLKGAGISDEAIAAYGSVGRLGAMNADPTRLSAAMGAAGYAPNVTNQVLQTIAENTRTMAMRGIKVDMDSSVAWMEKALAAGKSPDVAAAAMSNMNAVAQEPLDIFQGVGRRVASASAMMAVMSDPRARGDSFMSVVNAAADTESVRRRMMTMYDPKSDLGQLNAFGATGTLGMEGIEGATRPGPQRLTPLSEAFDPNDERNPYRFKQSSATRQSWLWSVLQGASAFGGQQAAAGSIDIGAMQWSLINDWKGVITDALGIAIDRINSTVPASAPTGNP